MLGQKFFSTCLYCLLLTLVMMSSLHASKVWQFGSAGGRDGNAGMILRNTSSINGQWSLERNSLRFQNQFVRDSEDRNFTEALSVFDLSQFGYEPGKDFTLWLLLEINGVWEWNRLGLVAFAEPSEDEENLLGFDNFISARMQVLNRGEAEIALASDFLGRRGEMSSLPIPERLTNDSYRILLTGEHQPNGGLRLTLSLQRDDDDLPYVLSQVLSTTPIGTYFGFGGRIRSNPGHQPVIDFIELRYEPTASAVERDLPELLEYVGIWQFEGRVYRYRATLRREAHHDDTLGTAVLLSQASDGGELSTSVIKELLDAGELVVELNNTGFSGDENDLRNMLLAFRRDLPQLIQMRSEGLIKTEPDFIQLPVEVRYLSDLGPMDSTGPVEGIAISRLVSRPTPVVLAYNMGHFFEGSNARDWWRYSGATGARAFISPGHFEHPYHRPPGDFEVNSFDEFMAMRERLSANPDDAYLVNWDRIHDVLANVPLGGWNRISIKYALGNLSELSPDVFIQATVSEHNFPIEDASDWHGKWRLWRTYFSLVYYYASEFGIQRFSTHNEPNHHLTRIEPEPWMMRASLAADAAARAIEAVNRRHDKDLRPMMIVPVTAGDIGDPFTGPFQMYGRPILERWDLNFLGERIGQPLFANYAVQRYNARPDNFKRNLLNLKNLVAQHLPWNLPMPTFSITEFNVHHGRFFDTIEESMDSPSKFIHFAGIVSHLLRGGLEEFYVFKFGLTQAMQGRQFLVHKNGMFFTDNDREPHNYGGPTKGAEVYRLFIQAFAPGRDKLSVKTELGNQMDVTASHDPETNNIWVFSVNSHQQSRPLDLRMEQWMNDREGTVLITEVSEAKGGEVVAKRRLPSDGRLQLEQPAESVWLLRFPPALPDNQWETVSASAVATVWEGRVPSDIYSEEKALFAVNPADERRPRAVAMFSFELPDIDSKELQSAILSFGVQAEGVGDIPTQAQVFLAESADWDPYSIEWSTAPALLQEVPRGHFIRHRVVDNSSGAAQVLGQINLSSTDVEIVGLEIGDMLRNLGGKKVTFIVAQEPRWDVHPSEREANGDVQPYGLKLATLQADPSLRPRIQFLTGKTD